MSGAAPLPVVLSALMPPYHAITIGRFMPARDSTRRTFTKQRGAVPTRLLQRHIPSRLCASPLLHWRARRRS